MYNYASNDILEHTIKYMMSKTDKPGELCNDILDRFAVSRHHKRLYDLVFKYVGVDINELYTKYDSVKNVIDHVYPSNV
jgi:hypothetical protein